MLPVSKFKFPISRKVKMVLTSNLPYFLFSILYIMSANVFQADHIRTQGIYWKLDLVEDKVVSIEKPRNAEMNISLSMGPAPLQPVQDRVFEALIGTNMKNGIWTKQETLSYCTDDAIGNECNQTIFSISDGSASVR